MCNTWTELFREIDTVDLRKEIIEQFAPMWEANDRGHRREHFAAVEECGHWINEQMGLGFDPKLIVFMAWFHDLFAWDRNNHQEISALWILNTEHPLIEKYLNKDERKLVAAACREHRASYEGTYSHTFTEMMACADRGFPGDVKEMLERSMKYQLDKKLASTEEQARQMAVEHLKEKFGSNGYAKYPELYIKVFGQELEQQRLDIDTLT